MLNLNKDAKMRNYVNYYLFTTLDKSNAVYKTI